MKLFRWIVLLKNNPAGFYSPVSAGHFLAGFGSSSDGFLQPVWAEADPVLYKRKGARFIVSELRRVGYNAFSIPWLLLAIIQRIKARKQDPWKK